MERIIYLDNAASTAVDKEVLATMLPFFTEQYANPMTSGHSSLGDVAYEALEKARSQVAALLHAQPEQIIFTAGGTESDNTVLKGVLEYAAIHRFNGKAHLVTTRFEHHAILHSAAALERWGYEVTYVGVDSKGFVDPDDIRRALRPDTALVSVMHANNEIGTIEPIAEIAAIAHAGGALMHTDAVQSVAHIATDVDKLGVDFLSLSAHKFNGPKGVGVLYARNRETFLPFIDGGGQEWGMRGSTHNMPGIVGLGKAAELGLQRLPSEERRLAELRDHLFHALQERIPGVTLNGDVQKRVPQNLNIQIEGIDNEALLVALNEEGIIAAGGSACTAQETVPSHVLTAIGCSTKEAKASIRLSLGYMTTGEDIDRACAAIPRVVAKLRSLA